MIITDTDFANKELLERVKHGETIEVQHDGKTFAEIRPKVGVSREDLIKILNEIRFTEEEQRELKAAMNEANLVFGYAGRD